LISHTTMMGSMHRINSRLLPGLLESYMWPRIQFVERVSTRSRVTPTC
jgi:hypothetical protein